ncbi:MAG: Bifunctional methylenetetrahydrofolate dehydrogenase/methenyltetrahydrofolate cyclohydrolase FolD [Acidobacteriota bacterium]|nr:Bifunctional methylenetetrahydrofolate dehydrogenase/methenyltetrahydrofolate cyclohydrolase FolD [Acidobacteriota bacterium]
MTQLLEAKAVAAQIRAEVAAGAREIETRAGRPPGLAVVLVGDDPASRVYVASKTRACAEAGLASFGHILPATTAAADLLALLDQLNADPRVDGILVQMPLPAGLPSRDILDRVDPAKDVDGFHPVNVGRLWLDQPGFVPCTPAGIIESLRRHGIALTGRHAVVVGRSSIVGKPMAGLLLRENCTVTIAHSKSRDLPAVCREADLLVAAVGRPGMITPEHVKEGAVVVDVGINRVQDALLAKRLVGDDAKRLATLAEKGYALVGDVDFPAVAPKTSAITPVPGGVGPLTVAMLLANTLTSARRRFGLEAPAKS